MASSAVLAINQRPPATLFDPSPTYQMACRQLRAVAAVLPDIEPGIIERLTVPKRAMVVASRSAWTTASCTRSSATACSTA